MPQYPQRLQHTHTHHTHTQYTHTHTVHTVYVPVSGSTRTTQRIAQTIKSATVEYNDDIHVNKNDFLLITKLMK